MFALESEGNMKKFWYVGKLFLVLLGMSLFCFSAQVEANIYVYEDLSPSGNNSAGTFEHIKGTYDDVNQQLSWSASFSEGEGSNCWFLIHFHSNN